MYLPFVFLCAGGGAIGAKAEFHNKKTVVAGINGVLGVDIVDCVKEIAVAAKEVNLRAVVVGISAVERSGVATCAGHDGT